MCYQGLPFLKIITCPTSSILKFFDLPIVYEIKRKNLFKSTCPTGSFTCPGLSGSGKRWALLLNMKLSKYSLSNTQAWVRNSTPPQMRCCTRSDPVEMRSTVTSSDHLWLDIQLLCPKCWTILFFSVGADAVFKVMCLYTHVYFMSWVHKDL